MEQLFPSKLEWPGAVDDVNDVDRQSLRMRLLSKARGFEKLHEFKNLQALWSFGVDDKKLDHLTKCESLEQLYLDYQLRITDLTPLKRLPKLKVLRLDSCSRIDSLQRLSEFENLLVLAIENFKNVHDLKPLSALVNLSELAVEGSMWTRMKVDSLAPLESVIKLEYLSLSNLKVADESLAALHELSKLKQLYLANFYPFEEFARLAGKLPGCKCQWFDPYIITTLSCDKCGTGKRVLLTGKNKGMLCESCESKRIERHAADFERVKKAAARS